MLNFNLSILNATSIDNFKASFDNILNYIAVDFGVDFSVELQDMLLDKKALDLITTIYKKFGRMVILIDNYDKPIINSIKTKELLYNSCQVLKTFYNTIDFCNK